VRQPFVRVSTGIHHDDPGLQDGAIHSGQIVGIDDQHVTLM
jgi:hypothetical protein